MKKIMIIMLLAIGTKAQQLTHADIASGNVSQGTFASYVSKSGTVYKVGDTLKIGFPSATRFFAFIEQGDGFIMPIEPAPVSISGNNTSIKKIQILGTDRTGRYASFKTKGVVGTLNYRIRIEDALEKGEIKTTGMSSDEALAELKKEKDKFDLGLITKEQYEARKADLSKLIK